MHRYFVLLPRGEAPFEDSPDDALGLFGPYGGEDPEESYRKLVSRLDILSAVFAVAAFVFLGFFMGSL